MRKQYKFIKCSVFDCQILDRQQVSWECIKNFHAQFLTFLFSHQKLEKSKINLIIFTHVGIRGAGNACPCGLPGGIGGAPPPGLLGMAGACLPLAGGGGGALVPPPKDPKIYFRAQIIT